MIHSFDVTKNLKIYVGSSNWTLLNFYLNYPFVFNKPRITKLGRNDPYFLYQGPIYHNYILLVARKILAPRKKFLIITSLHRNPPGRKRAPLKASETPSHEFSMSVNPRLQILPLVMYSKMKGSIFSKVSMSGKHFTSSCV